MQVFYMANRKKFAVEQCSRTQRGEEIAQKARLTSLDTRRRDAHSQHFNKPLNLTFE